MGDPEDWTHLLLEHDELWEHGDGLEVHGEGPCGVGEEVRVESRVEEQGEHEARGSEVHHGAQLLGHVQVAERVRALVVRVAILDLPDTTRVTRSRPWLTRRRRASPPESVAPNSAVLRPALMKVK